MSSTFPKRLADDYVPANYLEAPARRVLPNTDKAPVSTGLTGSLRLIALCSGKQLLAVTAVPSHG